MLKCHQSKTSENFYTYKNTNKKYSQCKDCFNKKCKCDVCDKMVNGTYLNNHKKKVHSVIQGGIQRGIQGGIQEAENFNKTLIVGPSFCGKTYLVMNKLKLIKIDRPNEQIVIITRSPEQYKILNSEIDLRIEEDLEQRGVKDFEGCVVVFDDMLDSNQKLIDPFFTRGRHNDLDVYYLAQSYFDLPKRSIRNNSNIIILFQQTLKDVENIYRDIAGFDMSYHEFKALCREAWNRKHNYLMINRHTDKDKGRYSILNESNEQVKVFIPQTKPF